MLPNPKNNKKSNSSFPNLADTNTVDEAKEAQKKAQNKRKIIILSLIFTTGFSFLFWSFKSIEKFTQNLPSFSSNFKLKIPKFTFNKINQTTSSSSSKLSKYLEKSPINWSIYLSLDSNYLSPIFESNSKSFATNDNLVKIIDSLNAVKLLPQSLTASSLPQGLNFQEINNSSGGLYYQGLVSLPKNKILILVNYQDSNDTTQVENNLPTLIEHLYWYAVSFLD